MRLEVNDIKLDYFETSGKFKVPMTYGIKGILDPEKIKGAYSSTITLPPTKNNQKALGNPLAYNLDNKRLPCKIVDDGEVIYGFAYVRERSSEFYKLFILSNNATWFNKLDELYLKDLKLGTETMTYGRQVETFNSDTLVYYPVIDYGGFRDQPDTYDVQPKEIYPATRVKQVLDVAFNSIDHSVKWAGSLATKKWVMPFTHGEILYDEDWIDDNSVKYSTDGVATDTSTGPYREVPLSTVLQDVGGNDSSFRYTCPTAGRIEVSVKGTITFSSVVNGGGFFVLSVYEDFTGANTRMVEATEMLFQTSQSGGDTYYTIDVDYNAKLDGTLNEDYSLAYRIDSPVALNPQSFNLTVEFRVIPEYDIGSVFDVALNVPDIKATELVKAITTLYNVVWEIDGSTVTATPYEEWLSHHAEDWREKSDLNYAQRFQSVRQDRELHFKWNKDQSDKNLLDFREAGDDDVSWGDYRFDIDNENATRVNEISVPFASTWMGMSIGFWIPQLWKDNGEYDATATAGNDINVGTWPVKYSHDARFLLEEYSPGTWTHYGVSTDGMPTCTFFHRNKENKDNLSFKDENFYGNSVGLVSKYWGSHIRLWEQGFKMIGHFMLRPSDIRKLDFSTPKVISTADGDKLVWLEEVTQFKHGDDRPTKVKCYGY